MNELVFAPIEPQRAEAYVEFDVLRNPDRIMVRVCAHNTARGEIFKVDGIDFADMRRFIKSTAMRYAADRPSSFIQMTPEEFSNRAVDMLLDQWHSLNMPAHGEICAEPKS